VAGDLGQFRPARRGAPVGDGADLVETGFLAGALLTNPASPGVAGDIAGLFTAIKAAAGAPAQILGLAHVVVGLGLWTWRRLRSTRVQPR
jgi:hypothetical protein